MSNKATAMSMELVRSIDALVKSGLHVTTFNIGGMTCAEAHEPTDEARQEVIDDFKRKYCTRPNEGE